VRQYRAELKNADAGMEKGEKTVDSLSRKIEAQSKIVEQEQAKLDALKDELKRYEETVQKGEGIIADLTEKHKQAAAQYGETSDEAKKYAKELREAQTAQEKNTKKVDELRTAIINQNTVLKNSQHQVEVYKNDLDELGKEEKEVGDEAEKTTNGGLSAFGVALGNLAANVISNLVSKLGELITQTVKTGAAFEQSMSKVQAISGATNEDMDRLNDTAKKLGE
jgi:chromosome segregation ATPase